VRFWDPATGEGRGELPRARRPVYALAFVPGGALAAGNADGTVGLWDVAARQLRATLRRAHGRAPAVYAVTAGTDGRMLAAGHSDGTVTLWDLASGKERAVLHRKGRRRYFVLSGHSPAVALSPDGKLLAAARTENLHEPVRLWNGVTAQFLGTLEDPDRLRRTLREAAPVFAWGAYRTVYGLAFSGDGKLLAAALGPAVVVWDVETRTVRHRFGGHNRKVFAVAFSPDGLTLASASADRTVRLWDPTAPPRVKRLSGRRGRAPRAGEAPAAAAQGREETAG
jgi:WD40 repeat protein